MKGRAVLGAAVLREIRLHRRARRRAWLRRHDPRPLRLVEVRQARLQRIGGGFSFQVIPDKPIEAKSGDAIGVVTSAGFRDGDRVDIPVYRRRLFPVMRPR